MNKLLKQFKQFTPPFLSQFILKNLGYMGLSPWKYVPEGFSYKTKDGGWNLDEIALLQYNKWGDYSKRIKGNYALGINHESDNQDTSDPFFHNLLCAFAYVLSLSGIKKSSLKFLDWGGGIGHYGLLAEELLKSTDLKVEYYCYDFDVFGKYGKELNPHFTFFNDEKEYQSVSFDLIMASSSIWYERNWHTGVDKLISHKCEYLYITRMIFIEEKPSYVSIQKPSYMGYETEYLFWVINKQEFLTYLDRRGYTLLRQFEFGQVTPIFQAPEQGSMKGFLFKRRID